MVDVVGQINAVRRVVGSRVFNASELRTVTISQRYDTTVEDLWDACTTAERIARWFLPVAGDLRLHGRFQLTGNAGGTIERCDPPNSFTATWEFGGETSWIEVRCAADGGGARLEIEHIGPGDDEKWAQFGPGAVGIGWDGALCGLALHFRPDGSPDLAKLMTLSGERWCAASVAAGADEQEARAAAQRTIAFYTGTA